MFDESAMEVWMAPVKQRGPGGVSGDARRRSARGPEDDGACPCCAPDRRRRDPYAGIKHLRAKVAENVARMNAPPPAMTTRGILPFAVAEAPRAPNDRAESSPDLSHLPHFLHYTPAFDGRVSADAPTAAVEYGEAKQPTPVPPTGDLVRLRRYALASLAVSVVSVAASIWLVRKARTRL